MKLIDGDALADMLSGVRRRLDPKAYKSEAELYIRDNMLLNLEEMVRSAPTIDPVKHGRWEEHGQNAKGDIFRCSNCKVFINPDRADKEIGSLPKTLLYCPNCGARMDANE